MAQHSLRLIAGLGNPDKKYRSTRHNIGFMVVDEICKQDAITLKKPKFDACYGLGYIHRQRIVMVKPMAYMNCSGPPVQRHAHYYKIRTKDIIVVHDDIDLAFGMIKIKEKGGDGGHRGLRSIIDALGGNDFIRIRIGVGRSQANLDAADHVLSNFHENEISALYRIIEMGREAIITLLRYGAKECMNRYNGKPIVDLN